MQPVPADGETMGEIVFRGNITMKGYLKNPSATRDAFAGGWFHTGDLGVLAPDGYVKIKDRSKDIIISGGENISLARDRGRAVPAPGGAVRGGRRQAGREVGRDAVRVHRAPARRDARPPRTSSRTAEAPRGLQGAARGRCSPSCRRRRPARSRSSSCASASARSRRSTPERTRESCARSPPARKACAPVAAARRVALVSRLLCFDVCVPTPPSAIRRSLTPRSARRSLARCVTSRSPRSDASRRSAAARRSCSTGVVASREEHQAIVAAIAETPGVTAVDDRMLVWQRSSHRRTIAQVP